MKKLVAIALVLAMASMANAGVGFVAVGGNNVVPGQVVTIQLISPDLQCAGGVSLYEVSSFGAGGIASAAATTFDSTMVVDLAPDFQNTTGTAEGVGILFYGGAAHLPATLAANKMLFQFNYTVPAVIPAGGITIGVVTQGKYMYGDGGAYDADPSFANMLVGGAPTDVTPENVVLVPEPMTLGLLSLGGLFLRRRLA